MPYLRFAHLNKVHVIQNEIVEPGQHIGDMGNTGFSTASHLHFDIIKKKPSHYYYWVKGWSRERVRAEYIPPKTYLKGKPDVTNWHHTGYSWCQRTAQAIWHPGEDMNGPGSGNADVGQPIYSPIKGRVLYANKTNSNGYGFGYCIVLEELEQPNTEHMEKQLKKIQEVLDAKGDQGYVKHHIKHQSFEEMINDKRWDDALKRYRRLTELEKTLKECSDTAEEVARERDDLKRNRLDLAQQLDQANEKIDKLVNDLQNCISKEGVNNEKEIRTLERQMMELSEEKRGLEKQLEECKSKAQSTDVAYELVKANNKLRKCREKQKTLQDTVREERIKCNDRINSLENQTASDYTLGQLASLFIRKLFNLD